MQPAAFNQGVSNQQQQQQHRTKFLNKTMRLTLLTRNSQFRIKNYRTQHRYLYNFPALFAS